MDKIKIGLGVLLFLIFNIGCKENTESQIKSFVKDYNNTREEIIKGNGFVDTKSTYKEPNTINIDVIIKSGNKTGIKNFLSKYDPRNLPKAIDYITDPSSILEQGVVFSFNFYRVNGDILLSKKIDIESYKKYKNETELKAKGNVNQPFYLKVLNEELTAINKKLPITNSNTKITYQKVTRDEKDYLFYSCSCSNTSSMKQNNRIYKANFAKSIISFPLLTEIYLLMNEVNIKALKFNCLDEDTKKYFDFVFYKKDVLDLY
jgi:hypothetical protein